MAGSRTIKSAIESMMFVWGKPLAAKDMAQALNVDVNDIVRYCRELGEEYDREGRGIVVREVDRSFQFATRPENIDYIETLCTPVKKKKLTQSALEVLAIIAYRQPVTKGEIESIRGVRCDRVIEGLAVKDLVEEKGRADTVGRPVLYGTTDEFLKQFGFASIKELPDIEELMRDGDGDLVYSEQISIDL